MAAIRSDDPTRPTAVLRQRADFLKAASAQRKGMPGFLLQARKRREDEPVAPDLIRVGFTCSKKLGNAVARNRAKRRLREIARAVLPKAGRPGWDYVLVGRPEATACTLNSPPGKSKTSEQLYRRTRRSICTTSKTTRTKCSHIPPMTVSTASSLAS